ncbi:hypothetical protein K474DRAFT_1043110 [Panus rudis PR-1116 ss-1]|nr:hypothetical protein K474DRAFT_1043110 [Panus rudis PR-1116 ss-1]
MSNHENRIHMQDERNMKERRKREKENPEKKKPKTQPYQVLNTSPPYISAKYPNKPKTTQHEHPPPPHNSH